MTDYTNSAASILVSKDNRNLKIWTKTHVVNAAEGASGSHDETFTEVTDINKIVGFWGVWKAVGIGNRTFTDTPTTTTSIYNESPLRLNYLNTTTAENDVVQFIVVYEAG